MAAVSDTALVHHDQALTSTARVSAETDARKAQRDAFELRHAFCEQLKASRERRGVSLRTISLRTKVSESLFARGLGAHVLWVGLLMAGLALGTQAWFVAAGEEQARWQTLTFTMLCFVQLGHVLAVRSERESLFRLGLFTNRPLLGAVLLAIALQLAIIYLPVMNALFRTAPLSLAELALTVAGAVLVFAAVEIEKLFRDGKA